MSSEEMPEEPVAVPIDVRVQWCGFSYYPVSVQQDGNIGDLKRLTSELVGLPAKRQRHMDPRSKVLNDEYRLGSLPNPPRTDLVGLNNMVLAETYNKHFYRAGPECTVNPTKDRIVDFHGSQTKLSKGTYKVGSMVMDCLIKCYKTENRGDLLRSIELMRDWKHPNVVVIENLHKDKFQRLVLSSTISGTLRGYIKAGIKKEEKEDVISKADGTFTVFFTKIILDMCAVLDEMVKRGIYPINLSRENLYLKAIGNADPELIILFDNVDRLSGNRARAKQLLTSLFHNIKAICAPSDPVHKHEGTEAFCKFLGNEASIFVGKNLAKTAAHYPISWTNVDKSKYLIDLIPSSVELRRAINACGISWPRDGGGNMNQELQTLKNLVDEENEEIRKEKEPFEKEIGRLEKEKKDIKSEEKNQEIRKAKLESIDEEIKKNEQAANKIRRETIWNYEIDYGYDLLRLTRNLWKHFATLPQKIKLLLGDKDAILAALERWCPGVWVLLYNAIGLGF